MPNRVQLSRRRGWRKPPGCIVVARPGPWGNPFKIDADNPAHGRAWAVRQFRDLVAADPAWQAEARAELAGKDLACWCPLGLPCHADILLEIANPPPSP